MCCSMPAPGAASLVTRSWLAAAGPGILPAGAQVVTHYTNDDNNDNNESGVGGGGGDNAFVHSKEDVVLASTKITQEFFGNFIDLGSGMQ